MIAYEKITVGYSSDVYATHHEKSDTPQTDLWLKQQIVCNYEHEMVSAGFARTLERERNKERAVSEKRRTLLIYFMEAVGKVEIERDEDCSGIMSAAKEVAK